MLIYFLRKKGTTDQYYPRRGTKRRTCCSRKHECDRFVPMDKAACWTSINGPRPLKGNWGEIVAVPLNTEMEGVVG